MALLFLLVSVAWALAVAALRRPRFAAELALPAGILLAVPVSIGSLLPFGSLSRRVTADVTLVADVGLWAAAASLLLAALATAVGMWPRLRPLGAAS